MDSVRLQQVVPNFLESEKINGSEIWNKDISILKGEKVQVVAPSGSGKTSLIHFIYGLRKDYSGNLLIDKSNVKEWLPERWSSNRRVSTSIVFQDLRLFPDQSARENIEVKRLLEPYASSERMEQMAAQLGILSKLDQPARICSYGEQQRIAIIRALQQPFDLLILDEPFSHLDENNREKAMLLIEEEVAARKATLLLADLKPIEYFNANRILHL
jgi:putative ABC transport system ATP-binding protein